MTLTEQWKKGELKEGVYYVRNEYDVIFAAENYINYDCFNDTKACDFYNVETNIKEVIAPVPSFKEMKLIALKIDVVSEKIAELTVENRQLKELLKDCRFILREMSDVNNWLESDDCVLNYDMATECEKYATKITNAIGEK